MKNFKKKFLRLFKPAYLWFLRRRITPPLVAPHELQIRLARTPAELKQAYHILYQSYVEKGYQNELRRQYRIIKHFLSPSTSTVVALWNNEVVGTLTIIQDNELGVPLEKNFDVSLLRNKGRIFCEISSLAIAKPFRHRHQIVFFLFHFYYTYARDYLGLDAAVMTVNPKQLEWYQALFFFKPLETKTVEEYDFVNGAPAVGLYHLFEVYNDSVRKHAPKWARFFLDLDFACHEFPVRNLPQAFDPTLDENLIKEIFFNNPEVASSISDTDRKKVLTNYPNQHLLIKTTKLGRRERDPRFRFFSKGFFALDNVYFSFRILNISHNGILVSGYVTDIDLEKPYSFFVRINGKVLRGQIQFFWKNVQNQKAGGGVIEASAEWRQLVQDFTNLFPDQRKKEGS